MRELVVTRGARGMSLVGRKVEHFPAFAQEVYDVTGAGDTVAAVLAMAVGKGIGLREAIPLANVCAGVVVRRVGPYAPSPMEVLQVAEGFRAKVVGRKELREIVGALRAQGKKIVFTNGVFDILHPGHVRYLQEARRLGDVLIVGINTDASVRRLKGPGRPVNRLADRAEVLASLEMVDFVVPFGEDTPAALIRLVRPDVLVKGGDYAGGRIVGKEFVESYGGKVVTVSYVEGYSTTRFLERVRRGK